MKPPAPIDTTVPAFFIAGLDLGQAQDPSALSILAQRRPGPDAEANYTIKHLHRWELGTPYPQIVSDVVALTRTSELAGRCELVIDGTGCGRPVVDQFRASAISCGVRAVMITAGHGWRYVEDSGYWHVAKVELVSVMRVLLGTRRLRFLRKLPLTPVLERELSTFTAKITNAGTEVFAADWRQQAHDDIVLATALAAFVGETIQIGPFTASKDKDHHGIFDDAPEGLFRDEGDRLRWPW